MCLYCILYEKKVSLVNLSDYKAAFVRACKGDNTERNERGGEARRGEAHWSSLEMWQLPWGGGVLYGAPKALI